jgi:hypothetical protein
VVVERKVVLFQKS